MTKKINVTFNLIGVIFVFICAFASLSKGQQTVVSVPSGDVLDKGKFYFELDSTFKFDKNPNNVVGRFSGFVPRLVVGVGKDTEIGVNIIGNIQPGADSTAIVAAVKKKVYKDESWSIVAGDHVFIPVRNRSYNIGNYVYLQTSKQFKTNTRVTCGAYHTSKNVFASKAQRAGGQFAIEQSINSKLSLSADWITGKHSAGYFSPLATIKPHPKTSIYLGYSIGNADVKKGNHFFYAAFGINLN